MEGIMMRGPEHICCAVRKPDGTIETKIEDTPETRHLGQDPSRAGEPSR